MNPAPRRGATHVKNRHDEDRTQRSFIVLLELQELRLPAIRLFFGNLTNFYLGDSPTRVSFLQEHL